MSACCISILTDKTRLPSMSTTTLKHPTIGNVVGDAASEDVSKYLGIQYATLTDRFSPPQIKEYPQGGTVDATKYG